MGFQSPESRAWQVGGEVMKEKTAVVIISVAAIAAVVAAGIIGLLFM